MNIIQTVPTFTETDFLRFNPEGFEAVKETIESARLKRALALTAEEMREAALVLQGALDRKNAERRLAEERFNHERQRAQEALEVVSGACGRGSRNCDPEILDEITRLVGRFMAKQFGEARDGAFALQRRMRVTEERRPRVGQTTSASSHFYNGVRLEQVGDVGAAVRAYEDCLAVNPRHVQALGRLERLRADVR